MSSSYEFIFDVILDYSNSNIIIPTGDISNNLTIDNLSEISGVLVEPSNTNFVDNLEESLVNIINGYMNTSAEQNDSSLNTLDSSGSRLSNFLQRNPQRWRQRLPLRQNFIYESPTLDNEYMSFLNSFLGIGTSTRFNNILNESLNYIDQKKYKNVISEEGKEGIKIKEYKKSEYSDQICCPMTLNDFNEGDEVAELPCGHIFEKDAVFKWLEKEDNRCPVCRKELPSKEIKIQTNISTQDNSDNEDNTDDGIDDEIDDDDVPDLVENFDNESTNQIDISNNETVGTSIPPNYLSRTTLPRLTTRQLFNSIINRELRRQDEEDLQAAIMASLLDVSNN
jgi:hypothetical protein